MNRESLLRKIKQRATEDRKRRQDPRFLKAMAFLVAKGFLKTNLQIHPLPNLRLQIDDVIWAGENVEPRLLEVLPAAVLRLGRHFDLDKDKHPQLAAVVEHLRKGDPEGQAFFGIDYKKVKVWADLPLRDKRIKTVGKKKISRTYRFDPKVIKYLSEMALKENSTETAILEQLVLRETSGPAPQ